jgi:hypothetical protein
VSSPAGGQHRHAPRSRTRHQQRPAPRRRLWLRARIALLAAPLAVAAMVMVAGSAAHAASGGWLDRSIDHGASTYTQSLMDDPIVFPNKPGASHMHDFFCTKPNAFSTYSEISRGPTVCPNDTGSYWAPSLYRNGVQVKPIQPSGWYVRQQIYYRGDNVSYKTLTSFPPDLRMLAGNSHATGPAQNSKLGKEIYWGCSDNSEPTKEIAPINCSTGIISLHIGFPNCWDGVLTHVNDTSHVVYPSSGTCPASNPIALPRLIMRIEYPVGTNSSGITLASGPAYTAHADFWNTWDQPNLKYLVNSCLNQAINCGTNPSIPSSTSAPGPTPAPTPTPSPSSTPVTTTSAPPGCSLAPS